MVILSTARLVCACGHRHAPDDVALLAGAVVCRCNARCAALVLGRGRGTPMT